MLSKFHNYDMVRLSSQLIADHMKEGAHQPFQLVLSNNKTFSIELEPSGIVAPNYQLHVLTEKGIEKIAAQPNFLYKGFVSGTKGEVRLAIKKGYIYGYISDSADTYYLEPLKGYQVEAGEDEFVVYKGSDLVGTPLSCGTGEEDIVPSIDGQLSTLQANEEGHSAEIIMGIRGSESTLSNICRKIRFVPVADYSIYEKFNYSIEDVQAALLANLNMAESAFATLNLGPNGSTDVGTDHLQFEVQNLFVSTCATCDITDNSNRTPALDNQFTSWINSQFAGAPQQVYQFWTTRRLYDPTPMSLAGYSSNIGGDCRTLRKQYLRYYTDDAASLRVLVAHETGHNFGCWHDNQKKAEVSQYIMFSSASASHTRFSTLGDFSGMDYSSHKALRDDILLLEPCLEGCGTAACEEVKNIQVTTFKNTDSVQISWEGNGEFITAYKPQNAIRYEEANSRKVDGNSIIIKGLEPCRKYHFEARRVCGGNATSSKKTVVFGSSSLNLTARPINMRGKLYDLQLEVECNSCSSQEFTVSIDRRDTVRFNSSLNKLVVKDLFADGARHRIKIEKLLDSDTCSFSYSYDAPYYREGSTQLLATDFNDCKIPSGWKDSLLQKAVPSDPTAFWIITTENRPMQYTPAGSFDSSCMLNYDNYSYRTTGARSLTSPEIDLTGYKDPYLHFDYNFFTLQYIYLTVLPSFIVELYNGSQWVTVLRRDPVDSALKRAFNIWDSLPARVFIPLEKYKVKNFRVRFTVDDGSLAYGQKRQIFTALDNIAVDGYAEDVVSDDPIIGGDSILIGPNPVHDFLHIKLKQASTDAMSYYLTDMAGRIVKQGELKSGVLKLDHLSNSMYVLRVFRNKQAIGTFKIIKY